MAIGLLLVLVVLRSVRILLEGFLVLLLKFETELDVIISVSYKCYVTNSEICFCLYCFSVCLYRFDSCEYRLFIDLHFLIFLQKLMFNN